MTTERRWVEGEAPPEVRQLLDSAVIDEATAAQLASLEARMATLLVTPLPTVPTAAGGTGIAVKIIGGVALLAVGTGAGLWLGRRAEPPPVPAVVVQPIPAPAPSVAPQVVLPIPEAAAPTRQPLPMRRPVPEPTMQKPEVVEDELALLQAAMSAPTPAQSLELVERHLAKFPNGELAQEREVLAIKALMKLERFDDARARADAFKVRWPTSPHALRVEALLKKADGN